MSFPTSLFKVFCGFQGRVRAFGVLATGELVALIECIVFSIKWPYYLGEHLPKGGIDTTNARPSRSFYTSSC